MPKGQRIPGQEILPHILPGSLGSGDLFCHYRPLQVQVLAAVPALVTA